MLSMNSISSALRRSQSDQTGHHMLATRKKSRRRRRRGKKKFTKTRSDAAKERAPREQLESDLRVHRDKIQQLYETIRKSNLDEDDDMQADAHAQGYMCVTDIMYVLSTLGMEMTPSVYAAFEDIERQRPDVISFGEFYGFIVKHQDVDARHDNVVYRALTNRLAVPNFSEFCTDCVSVLESTRSNKGGHTADYIPELKNAEPEYLGLSVCTVDGQIFNYGDSGVPFSIQSCHKPFNYALALEEHGADEVHKYVGTEPSGVEFNAFTLLNDAGVYKPHNPMINAGAMVSTSLIQRGLPLSERFAYLAEAYARLAGRKKLGFCNSVYLSEIATADRNYALAHFMHGAGVFRHDPSTKIRRTVDLYTQCCSVEVNASIVATMAATLANRGTCPTTNQQILSTKSVRQTLKLLFSAGMYDFSGNWAMNIGLPAKSGVAGCVFVVVPNIMGICVFSPRLDEQGNSVRAVEFFTKLCARYPLGVFQQLTRHANPFRRIRSQQATLGSHSLRSLMEEENESETAPTAASTAAMANNKKRWNLHSPSFQKRVKKKFGFGFGSLKQAQDLQAAVSETVENIASAAPTVRIADCLIPSLEVADAKNDLDDSLSLQQLTIERENSLVVEEMADVAADHTMGVPIGGATVTLQNADEFDSSLMTSTGGLVRVPRDAVKTPRESPTSTAQSQSYSGNVWPPVAAPRTVLDTLYSEPQQSPLRATESKAAVASVSLGNVHSAAAYSLRVTGAPAPSSSNGGANTEDKVRFSATKVRFSSSVKDAAGAQSKPMKAKRGGAWGQLTGSSAPSNNDNEKKDAKGTDQDQIPTPTTVARLSDLQNIEDVVLPEAVFKRDASLQPRRFLRTIEWKDSDVYGVPPLEGNFGDNPKMPTQTLPDSVLSAAVVDSPSLQPASSDTEPDALSLSTIHQAYHATSSP